MRRPDGSYRWKRTRVRAYRGVDGRVARLLGIDIDITERKHAEEKAELLARELDHRPNNLLALIGAMMRQTRADTVPDLVAVMQGRIGALAPQSALWALRRA